MFDRYNRTSFKKALENPEIFYQEVQRIYSNPARKFKNWRFKSQYDGIDVMSEDWDNMYILDACRYDYFKKVNAIEGDLRPVISKGGHSRTFMEENFVGRKLHDTVYVTANLHADFLDQDIFYTVEMIPYSERNPERVASCARKMHQRYPDKRIIVHFMQPHKPYLGPTGEQIREQLRSRGRHDLIKRGNFINWEAHRRGQFPTEKFEQAYRENIEIALSHVEKLIDEIAGKSVVTADHGELFGERVYPLCEPLYGHPDNVYIKELLTVPWLEIRADSRREITTEEPIGFEPLDSDLAKRRLQELGYVQ